MDIVVVDNYLELSKVAADIVVKKINDSNKPVLGLATGSTPEGMYSELVSLYRNAKVDFGNVISFNLDEYFGLSSSHPQSYNFYMHKNLFDHVNIKAESIHIPNGKAENPELTCKNYDRSIVTAGGIDLQILGIGNNGHIGFNEPDQCLAVETHVVELTADTIEANSRFFETRGDVPSKAITMGMGSIMFAKKILLLASGIGKAMAINRALSGYISTLCPASLLQLHSQVTVILDQEAASMLNNI